MCHDSPHPEMTWKRECATVDSSRLTLTHDNIDLTVMTKNVCVAVALAWQLDTCTDDDLHPLYWLKLS